MAFQWVLDLLIVFGDAFDDPNWFDVDTEILTWSAVRWMRDKTGYVQMVEAATIGGGIRPAGVASSAPHLGTIRRATAFA